MKIGNWNGIELSRLYKRQLEEKQEVKKHSEDKPAADSLVISGEAAKMQELVKDASQQDEVRAERVRELKDAIEKGEYKPDSNKTAAAMLEQKE